jgi:hypothetical protein
VNDATTIPTMTAKAPIGRRTGLLEECWRMPRPCELIRMGYPLPTLRRS